MQEPQCKLFNCPMKKLKAYTLMEVMVVMIIMIILLGLSYSSYTSFTETTKFNEDVSTLQHDILVIQRASMLMERNDEEGWIYGLGIYLGDLGYSTGTGYGAYTFFKWCSEYPSFTNAMAKEEYPGGEGGMIPTYLNVDEYQCINSGTPEQDNKLVSLIGYGYGALNLKEDVYVVNSNIAYIVFEAVSGRTFMYDIDGNRVDEDLEIRFDKNFGTSKILTVKN